MPSRSRISSCGTADRQRPAALRLPGVHVEAELLAALVDLAQGMHGGHVRGIRLDLGQGLVGGHVSMPLPPSPPPQPATRAIRRDGHERSSAVGSPGGPYRLGAAAGAARGGNLRGMATGTTTRVFIARLAGLTVLDPNADQVGRVRDVVVVLRTGAQPPRVLGLVVEVQPRRRVFMPMGQVSSVDADSVIVRGRINLRRFERRPGETLVITELLDRKVATTEDGTTVTVVDVAMDQSRTRDWFVTRVAVRSGGAVPPPRPAADARLGPGHRVHPAARRSRARPTCSRPSTSCAPPTSPTSCTSCRTSGAGEVAAALDDERLADVLEELPEDDQVEILAAARGASGPRTCSRPWPPTTPPTCWASCRSDEQERLLALMEPDEADPVRRLLTYSENTAGGMMTTEPVVLPPDATVAEALARVRDPEPDPALAAQVYVCRPPTETPTGKFLGIAHIQRLLREPPSALVSGVVDSDIDPLGPDCPLTEVTAYLATYNLVAVPDRRRRRPPARRGHRRRRARPPAAPRTGASDPAGEAARGA